MLSARFAGGIDTVGGNILGTMLRSIAHGGCVAACGLAASNELPITVYPFILRAITLTGIDAAWCSSEARNTAWRRLSGEWKLPQLEAMARSVTLDNVSTFVADILAGRIQGRTVVEVTKS
jgi:NADPH:quinone reductase-like Zn-dependent oxidoreductase